MKGKPQLKCYNEKIFREIAIKEFKKNYNFERNCDWKRLCIVFFDFKKESVFLSHKRWKFLLRQVVQHIKENWHEYGPFVIAEWNISDRQTYDNYMNMVGTFASELECTVATRMYDMNLSIYREINDRHELKRVFHNHVSSQFATARLLFTGNSDSGHYDVLVPD